LGFSRAELEVLPARRANRWGHRRFSSAQIRSAPAAEFQLRLGLSRPTLDGEERLSRVLEHADLAISRRAEGVCDRAIGVRDPGPLLAGSQLRGFISDRLADLSAVVPGRPEANRDHAVKA
jgi:hypothetical protein